MSMILGEEAPRARLALLLKHFSQIDDDREPWRVVYPLPEVLLLLTCGTIASCDDFDDIVAWGEHHLNFLTRRLWAWRAAYGADAWWAQRLGAAAIRARAAGFWPASVRA